MTDSERIKYLEGREQGLDRLCQSLVNHIQEFWPDLPTGLEWRIGFGMELRKLIKGLEKGDSIKTRRGQGQRDVLAEFEAKYFSR